MFSVVLGYDELPVRPKRRLQASSLLARVVHGGGGRALAEPHFRSPGVQRGLFLCHFARTRYHILEQQRGMYLVWFNNSFIRITIHVFKTI